MHDREVRCRRACAPTDWCRGHRRDDRVPRAAGPGARRARAGPAPAALDLLVHGRLRHGGARRPAARRHARRRGDRRRARLAERRARWHRRGRWRSPRPSPTARCSASRFARAPSSHEHSPTPRGVDVANVRTTAELAALVADRGSACRSTATGSASIATSPTTTTATRRTSSTSSPRASGTGGAPVMVFVHGGAWTIGSKEQQSLPMLYELASSGWVVVTCNYRLSPRSTWPDHVVDVKRVVAWTKAHAAEFGGDPTRFLAISGNSAGGHLAALTALTPGDAEWQPGFEDADTSVDACVSIYGVLDMTGDPSSAGAQGRVLRSLLGRSVMKVRYDDARDSTRRPRRSTGSPSTPPPFLVLHGTKDTLVLGRHRARVRRARSARVTTSPIGYVELPWAQHGYDTLCSPRCSATVARDRRASSTRSLRPAADATASQLGPATRARRPRTRRPRPARGGAMTPASIRSPRAASTRREARRGAAAPSPRRPAPSSSCLAADFSRRTMPSTSLAASKTPLGAASPSPSSSRLGQRAAWIESSCDHRQASSVAKGRNGREEPEQDRQRRCRARRAPSASPRRRRRRRRAPSRARGSRRRSARRTTRCARARARSRIGRARPSPRRRGRRARRAGRRSIGSVAASRPGHRRSPSRPRTNLVALSTLTREAAADLHLRRVLGRVGARAPRGGPVAHAVRADLLEQLHRGGRRARTTSTASCGPGRGPSR